MIVYSNKIIHFLTEIKQTIKAVISKEIGLKVYGDRFYNQTQKCSYPLKIVVYNNKGMLGYFKSDLYELGFHECLMHVSKKQLHNIIRHELAHYITFITYGESIQIHGPEFRSFCQKMGWDEEVYLATTSLNVVETEKSHVFRKIQKLLALATSSNPHEAELAMIKSQQLLLKHNIESTYLSSEEEEKMFLKRVMKQKKEDGKMRCIASILETFFVNVVFHRGTEFTYLEILGNAINIEIAEYVAGVLESELDNLWNQAKKLSGLKGMIAKNSFFRGLAIGYCNKIKMLKRDYSTETSKAVMIIEKQLLDAKEIAYSRLSNKKSSASHCGTSSALGEKMGKQLNINPAINREKATNALIGYSI